MRNIFLFYFKYLSFVKVSDVHLFYSLVLSDKYSLNLSSLFFLTEQENINPVTDVFYTYKK